MSISHHFSTCPLDCPGACALEATLEEGKLVRLKGDKRHPFTQGVICGKVTRYAEIQNGERILTPLIRTGVKGEGTFRRASWDEAMEMVARRLGETVDQWGPESVYPYYYGGTMGVLQRSALDRLTHRAGFSRIERTICYPIGAAGWNAGVGNDLGPDASRMEESDLVILWGINAVSTHINLMRFVKTARKRGARLVVVDPYRNRTAKLADLHVNPRPGTDGALAAAMMGEILREGLADRDYLASYTDFDPAMEDHLRSKTPEWAAQITGLEASVIREVARLVGESRAAFIRIGLGMARQMNGAVNVHAVACLPALTGAWSRAGGGALFSTGGRFPVDAEPVIMKRFMGAGGGQPARSLDMSLLGRWLTDPGLGPKVHALAVMNANPAVSCPDAGRVRRGLAREDLFTVVAEQVMSDTARFADVLLPATTFLEHDDLYKSYGQHTLQHATALLPPRGEARCNHDVVNELARRLGYDDAAFHRGVGETIDAVLQASGLPEAGAWAGKRWLDFSPNEAEAAFTGGFPTADGRFHFHPGWDDPKMPPMPDHWPVNLRDGAGGEGDYPLDFMTPPDHEVLNSTFNIAPAVRERRGPPLLWINPADAAARGIADGDRVAVFNDLARLTMTARVTDDVRPGLCLTESNRPAADFPENLPLNALSHDAPVAPAGGPAFHDNRVEVEKA